MGYNSINYKILIYNQSLTIILDSLFALCKCDVSSEEVDQHISWTYQMQNSMCDFTNEIRTSYEVNYMKSRPYYSQEIKQISQDFKPSKRDVSSFY